jgi:tryptophanase
MPRTVIEPFRIKAVEPIRLSTRAERERLLREARLNPFGLRAEDVLLDFLTDSGTGAMSARQWAGIMAGDESYAGAQSFFRFEAAVRDLTGYPFVIPTHQGRAAERILFSVATRPGEVVPSNTHFDTTRANLEHGGVTALDLVVPEGLEPRTRHPFKGNIDLARVERLLAERACDVPLGMITVTNNSGGGQPVSLANLRAYRDLLRRHGKPLVIDACRFAENAMFVKLREPGQEGRTVKERRRSPGRCSRSPTAAP